MSFSSNGSGVTLRTKFGDVHFSTEEYTYYESLFKIADVQNDGFLTPTTSNVVTLLLRTDIPWKDVLQAIKLVLDVLPSHSATPLSSSPNNPSIILSSSSSLSSSSTQSSASRGVLANGSVDLSSMGPHHGGPIRFAHWLLLCKLLAIFKQQQQLQPTPALVALPQPPSENFVAKASKKGRKGQQQTPTPPTASSSTTSSESLLQQCLTLMTNGSELSTAELRFKLSRNVYNFAEGQCHKNYSPEISYWKVYGDDSFTHQHVKYGVVSHISLVNTTSIAVSFTTGPFTPPPAPPSPKATHTAVSVLVERRYSEFEQLAQTLRKQFPQYVVPPLPKKESPLYSMFVTPSLFAPFSAPSSTSAQSNPMAPASTTANGSGSSALTAGLAAPAASSPPSTADHVARRRQVALQLFLQAVCAHPVLRHAFAVGVFLEASTNGLRAFVDLSQHIVEGKLVFSSKNGRSSGSKDGASADRDAAEKTEDERGQSQVLQMLSNSASLVSSWSQQAMQSDVVQQWWGSVSKSLTSLLPAGGAAGGGDGFFTGGANGGVHPHYVPVEQLTQSGLRILEGIEQASKSMERWHGSESALADERGKICEGIKQVSKCAMYRPVSRRVNPHTCVAVVQMSDSVWSPEVAKVLSIFHHGLDRHTEFHRALQEAIYYTVLVPLLYLGQYREVLQSQNVAYYSQLTEKYVQASKQAEHAQQQLHQARQVPFDTSSSGNGTHELNLQLIQQAVLEKEKAVDKLSRDVHKAQVTLQSECARLKLEQRRKAVVSGVVQSEA